MTQIVIFSHIASILDIDFLLPSHTKSLMKLWKSVLLQPVLLQSFISNRCHEKFQKNKKKAPKTV